MKNMTLTPTEQQLAQQAARDHAKRSTAPDKETPDWIESDFKAGHDFALSHILPSRMTGFVEWVGGESWTHAGGNCWLKGNDETTTEQLYQKYNEYLKQKG